MKNVVLFSLFVFALPAATAVGQETPPVAVESAQVVPASSITQEATAPAIVTPIVPKLIIAWDCGDCDHNEKVPPLIEQAYAEEAKKHGFAVSDTDTAEVWVVDIRQRPPGLRVMAGFMAGKDRLGLRIRYREREYAISDTSANAIMGLNHLSASVGEMVYAELAVAAAE